MVIAQIPFFKSTKLFPPTLNLRYYCSSHYGCYFNNSFKELSWSSVPPTGSPYHNIEHNMFIIVLYEVLCFPVWFGSKLNKPLSLYVHGGLEFDILA